MNRGESGSGGFAPTLGVATPMRIVGTGLKPVPPMGSRTPCRHGEVRIRSE